MRRLPPMNAVRAFEAVVRTGSFTRAAQDLNVTHGAVSRQIRVLEEHLGVRLFSRSGRGLSPTPTARYYAGEIAQGLDRIESATTRLMEPSSTRVVRVNAPPTIVMHWLIPRLSMFQLRFPDTEIRLAASTAPLAEAMRTADVVLRRRPAGEEGLMSAQILSADFVPVCAPAIVESTPMKSIGELSRQTLLEADTMPNLWDEWLRRNSMDTLAFTRRRRYGNFYIALRAAMEGLGVAMASSALVSSDVEAGRLVFPFSGHPASGEPLRAFCSTESNGRGRVVAFVEWLKEMGDAPPSP